MIRVIRCGTCKHYLKNPDDPWDARCTVFPDGIPEKIITGQVSHKVPFPGDNGVLFEPRENKDSSVEKPKK